MAVDVKLTPEEINEAAAVARLRNQSQRSASRADGMVLSDSLGIDIQGAEAEKAVAVALGIKWDGKFFDINTWLKWRDVGHDVSGIEVRSTRHENGRLILHPKDSDNSPFILVISKKPVYSLVGWCWGKDGKRQDYWWDCGYKRPCYYVPRNNLKPINDLVIGP